MREIKYKAWLHKEKVLVDVLVIDFQKEEIGFAPLEKSANEFSKTGDSYSLLQTKKFDEIELLPYTWYKDKNYKEVYEGDIVYCHYETYTEIWYETFIVIFEDEYKCCFGFKTLDNEHFIPFGSSTHRDFEVIGNIYENPELLEVE